MTLAWLFVLLGLLGWALAQTLIPLAIERLVRRPGSAQSQPRRILLVCALPWLVAFTATLAMASLAAAKRWGWVQDHCVFHRSHHPHFCFEHLPNSLLDQGHVTITLVLLSIFGLLSLRRWREHRRQSSSLSALTGLSRGKGLLRVLEDSRLVAFAAGGKEPHIYLSQGLLRGLSRRERRMVLAHEAAHIRQGDLPAGRLMEILLLLHLKPYADRLRHLWRDAIEVRADQQVAHRFGRTATAELLFRLAKSTQAVPAAPGFGGGNLTLRIHTLLQEARANRRGMPVFEGMVGAGLLALLIGLWANHHALETLLGILIRL